jgi:CRISPR-associated endonuclease Cas3-HD
MDLSKVLAKSSGLDILTHTNDVVNLLTSILDKHKLSDDEKNQLILAAKLHDIGKLTTKFQKFLKKGATTLYEDKFEYGHTITGWYFIKMFLNHRDKNTIANLVLWHHANKDSCDRLNENLTKISKEISSDDLLAMKEFCRQLDIPIFDEQNDSDDISDKNEFYRVDNLMRSMLITADVCASSETSFDGLFNKDILDVSTINSDFLSSPRTLEQLDIVENIKENTTTLIKAPAGFGKTMIGVLWTLRRKNKLIWVCPTNVISDSVYTNIISELNTLGVSMNVELYLSGERIKANNTLSDFSSDIIVTNIDNFIKPSVSNSYGPRCLMIYDSDVIFDEVHEYNNMDCALFSAFNKIMDKRHNTINSTTLLLTATPGIFHFERVKEKTLEILPNKNEHYNAVHKEKYMIHFVDELPKNKLTGEFVCFSHIVSDVQNNYSNYNGAKLISHGRYLEEDKIINKNLVLDNYKKNGARRPYGVFTNQMLTTSCDYSVGKMFIKSPTIQSFFQSLGRINRWGDLNGVSNIYIISEKSKSDSIFIGCAETNRLQILFVNTLRDNFENKLVTLDELYVFYNTFMSENYSSFYSVSRDRSGRSQNMLRLIYPRKRNNGKSDLKVANSNQLRKSTSADEMFIYVKKDNSDEFVIMSVNVPKVIGTTKLFGENESTYKEQIKLIKTFPNFNKHKDINYETIRKEAIYYDSPYPVFNHIYNHEIGLIKLETNN